MLISSLKGVIKMKSFREYLVSEAKNSTVNNDVFDIIKTYIKNNQNDIQNKFMGSYAMTMKRELAKQYPQFFDDSSAFIPDWKRDYQYEYGKNWENVTFKKAAKEILGKEVFNHWLSKNKKKR